MDDFAQELAADFQCVAPKLAHAARKILQADFAYPVFVVTETPSALGEVLIPPQTCKNTFCYAATYLDQLTQQGVIPQDKVESFLQHYKDPLHYSCLLTLLPSFTHFAYLPYPTV